MTGLRRFGSTDLTVSPLCLGTWQLGGAWGDDVSRGVRAVRRAYELGINFFDTAYAYGDGRAERALAAGLGGLVQSEREQLVIATKGGLERRGDEYVRNSDAAWLRATLEQSLRNLGVDHVDIYLIHWPDPLVPLEETAGVVQGFVEAGLARHVGVSNFGVDEMRAYRRGGPLEAAQPVYNLLRREVEADVLPYCRDEGIGVMTWGALAQGMLTDGAREIVTRRPESIPYHPETLDRVLGVVERLADFAAGCGCTLAQLAVAWLLAASESVPIVGAENEQHIEATVAATRVGLSDADVAAIGAISGDAPAVERQPPIAVRRAA